MDRRIGTESDPYSNAAAVAFPTNFLDAHTMLHVLFHVKRLGMSPASVIPSKVLSPDAAGRPNRWRPRGSEWGLIALVLAIGVAFRLAVPSHMAVEHFDEGVYASNLAAGSDNGYCYPDRHLYAPPLLPALMEWSIVFFGPSHLAVMLANLTAGGLTIVLVWWIAGRWFGPAAAIAAATLASFSDIHILYSRTALTDPLLCFWLLAAVFLISEAYRRASVRKVLAAGLVTGLAWWTKYDGWLALAIGLAGLAPWMLFGRFGFRRSGRLLFCWIGMAAVAMVVWSPVVLNLPAPGYTAVARNHARYFVGLSGWSDSLLQQFGNLRLFDGPLSIAGFGLAVLLAEVAASCHENGSTWNRLKRTLPLTIAVGSLSVAGSLWGGTALVLGLVAVWGLLWTLFSSGMTRERAIGGWLTAAWFVGLLVGTPLYHPYPRLTLPWLVAAWIGCAAAVSGLAMWNQRAAATGNSPSDGLAERSRRSVWIAAVLIIVSVIALVAKGTRPWQRGVPGWQDRTGLEQIAGEIRTETAHITATRPRSPAPPIDYVIYVYGEPALFFHLANALSQDNAAVQPAANLGLVETHRASEFPVFLVTGPHADRSRAFQQQWQRLKNRFQPSGTYDDHPSDLVLLNQFSAEALTDRTAHREMTIRLYRLR